MRRTPCGIPANDIEQLVITRIGDLFSEPSRLIELVSPYVTTAAQQRYLLQRAAKFAASWPGLRTVQQRPLLLGLTARIVVRRDRVALQLRQSRIAAVL